MAEIIQDLGNRYGTLGSFLVQHQGRLFVVSGTDHWVSRGGNVEWIVIPANAHGAVTSWRDLATRDTREQAMAALEDTCHCGAPLRGSDHCSPAGGCGCEQYERYCDWVFDPDTEDFLDDDDGEFDDEDPDPYPAAAESGAGFGQVLEDEVAAVKSYLAGGADTPRRGEAG